MKKTPSRQPKAATSSRSRKGGASSATAVGSTSSGPSHPADVASTEMAQHAQDQDALAAAMPFNMQKSREYGMANATDPAEGASTEMPSATAGAGTLSEKNDTGKTGPAPLEPGGRRRRIGTCAGEFCRTGADHQSGAWPFPTTRTR